MNEQNRRKGAPEWVSWMIIGILWVSGAWFVALPWMLIKLFAPDKNKTEKAPPLQQIHTMQGGAVDGRTLAQRQAAANAQKNVKAERVVNSMTRTPGTGFFSRFARILGGVGAILFGATMLAESGIFLGILSFTEWFGLFTSVALLAGGAALIASGIASGKAKKRYARYLAVIGMDQAVNVSELASRLGMEETRVWKDLQKMVDNGVFGKSAYMNDELGYLFLNSKADDDLRAARESEQARVQARQDALTREPTRHEVYESILSQIRNVNDRIADIPMTEKIYKIENITRLIFESVEREPEKEGKIDRFLNYYLPTTQKLLESYAKLEHTSIKSDNVEESKKSIENAMDSVEKGFENLLDSLYEPDVIDIKSDIDVMTQMLNRDAPGREKDFVLSKPAEKKQEPVDNRTQFQKDFGIWPEGTKPPETAASSGTASAGAAAAAASASGTAAAGASAVQKQ